MLTDERSTPNSTESETPTLISPFLAWIMGATRKIPKTALIGVAGFLGRDTKASVKPLIDQLYSLTDERGTELDAEADALLTALAQKDYAYVGDFCRRWNIQRDSLPGYVIERIMQPIEINVEVPGLIEGIGEYD